MSIYLGACPTGLRQLINQSDQDKSKQNLLEQNYPFEMAVISSQMEKFDIALRLAKQVPKLVSSLVRETMVNILQLFIQSIKAYFFFPNLFL